jgi:hypothetical protein
MLSTSDIKSSSFQNPGLSLIISLLFFMSKHIYSLKILKYINMLNPIAANRKTITSNVKSTALMIKADIGSPRDPNAVSAHKNLSSKVI